MTNVPSFTYMKDLEVEYEGKPVVFDIAYGGSFFCLVDTDKNFGFKVSTDKAMYLKQFSSFLLKEVERTIKVAHPELDITSVDLVTCYSGTDSDESDYRTLNAFGNFDNPQLDRSPGGTATSALMSLLYDRGELKAGDDFVSESMMGARFKCRIIDETSVGPYKAIVPTVEGAAYLAGLSEWFIDPADPLGTGFVVPI